MGRARTLKAEHRETRVPAEPLIVPLLLAYLAVACNKALNIPMLCEQKSCSVRSGFRFLCPQKMLRLDYINWFSPAATGGQRSNCRWAAMFLSV